MERIEVGGRVRRAGNDVGVEDQVGEDALREVLDAPNRFERGRGFGDRAGVDSLRRQASGHAQRGGRSSEPFAHEIRFPAAQLDQPVERNAGSCGRL